MQLQEVVIAWIIITMDINLVIMMTAEMCPAIRWTFHNEQSRL
jgi:hypothetical protein